MHLLSCENPQRIYNKYTHEWLLVPCRHCKSCLINHQQKWVSKLEAERTAWKYCYMIFLSYDNHYLPKLYLSEKGDKIVYDYFGGLRHESVPINELPFDTDKDKEYFYARLHHPLGLPVCSVYDIQAFKKRLNKKIHDKITHEYKNFRSFICAEYGPTTQRPHYHGILFFNSDEVASHIKSLLSEVWKYGVSNAKFVESSACSYVASYVNSFDNLPSFYRHPKLRPFYVYSKQPPLGSCVLPQKETLSSFIECSPTRTIPAKPGQPFITVPNVASFEDRLYPRIKGYRDLSSTSRVGLYRFLSRKDWTFQEYCEFFHFVSRHDRTQVLLRFGVAVDNIANLCSYFKDFYSNTGDDNFKTYFYDKSKKKEFGSIMSLRSLYSISNRIACNAAIFGLTLEEYDYYIDLYHKNKEQLKLKHFYEFQEDYSQSHNPISLRLMYANIGQYDVSVPDARLTQDFQSMCSQSEYKFQKTQKTKDKNHYFNSKKNKDVKLKSIVSNYYGSEYFV